MHDGFEQGFCLQFQGPQYNFEANNLKSAIENPEAVEAKLQKELKAERIAGPFTQSPF